MEQLPTRSEIGPELKWKLEDIYPDAADWEKDFAKVKKLSAKLLKYKGRLASSSTILLEALNLFCELFSTVETVYAYARMRRDEDNADSSRQAASERASGLISRVSSECSFLDPEILDIPRSTLLNMLKEEPGLRVYKHYLEDLIRQKKHILDKQLEEVLALAGEVVSGPRNVYSIFNNADIKFSSVIDENGKEVELTKGRYSLMMENRDRRVRQDAFRSLYSSYKALRNTLAANYNASIKADWFGARVRKYRCCLEAALDRNKISPRVYNTLIETTNRNLHLLQRYLAVRKHMLKVDELHPYDLYVPIVDLPERKIPYTEAKKIVLAGLKPLGEKYLADMDRGMESGWIDVMESQGKTGGAYSWGAYRTHPFVLLNHQDNINSVFTLAHEMGHSMHTYYTSKTQHFINSEYPIFLAEVASTVNETLLMQYMIGNTEDRKEKAWLLNHYLEEFRGTMFRQVMFAEFEKITHAEIEKGGALTADFLCASYMELNKKYFGSGLVLDSELEMEWARIPHFYRDFYVYQYATGFASAASISHQILNEAAPAVERYLEFLSSGRKDYPLVLLKKAGVDLSSPEPVQDAFYQFENILNQMEALL